MNAPLRSATAAALPLDELQTMSRGDLVQASNVLHAGWSYARQQAEAASLMANVVFAETADKQRVFQEKETEWTRTVESQARKISTLEIHYDQLYREHVRLQSLLHSIDEDTMSTHQEMLQRCVDAKHVSVPVDDVQAWMYTIKSSKFRIADLEDQVMSAKADTIRLERVLRGRTSVDHKVLEGTVAFLEDALKRKQDENSDLKLNATRSAQQIAVLTEEANDLKKRLQATEQEDDDALIGGGAGSFMSGRTSWATATPGASVSAMKRRGREGPWRLPSGSGEVDDSFGPALSCTESTQTENLVLQNVELLYRLQRDLADLNAERQQYEANALQHAEEKSLWLQRIASLEEAAKKRDDLIEVFAATAAKRNTASSNNTTGSSIQLDAAVSFANEELNKTIATLSKTIDDQRSQIIELHAKASSFEDEMKRMKTKLAGGEERESHLNNEIHRLTSAISSLAEENAQLQAMQQMSEGGEGEEGEVIAQGTLEQKRKHDDTSSQALAIAKDQIERQEQDLRQVRGRCANLEEEITTLNRKLENQQNLVVRTLSERDSAVRECHELVVLLQSQQSQQAALSPTVTPPQSPKRNMSYSMSLLEHRHELARLNEWHETCLTAMTETSNEKLSEFTNDLVMFLREERELRALQHRRELVEQRLELDLRSRLHSKSASRQHPDSDAVGLAPAPSALPHPRPPSPRPTSTINLAFSADSSLLGSRSVSLAQLAAGLDAPITPPPLSLRDLGRDTSTSPPRREPLNETRTATDNDVAIGVVVKEECGALVVQSVVKNSPAYVSGLKETDCIVSVDGTVVNTLEEFAAEVSGKRRLVFSILAGGGTFLSSGGVEAAGKSISFPAAHLDEVEIELR